MVDVIGSANWEFNVTDRLALHYLEDTEIVHWVGAHWGDKVSSKIVEAVSPAFTEGWTRLKLIEKLKEALADQVRRSDSYWSGLANNAVTRSRNFGLTEAASQAGFQRGTIVAFIDEQDVGPVPVAEREARAGVGYASAKGQHYHCAESGGGEGAGSVVVVG